MPELLGDTRLDAVNALIKEVTLPMDFSLALMSGRPELLKFVRRSEGMNVEETSQVVHAFGVLLQTNQALQDHTKKLAEEIKQLRGSIKGLMNKVNQIDDLVNFRESDDTVDEG